jgi:hypothetical protein
MDREDGSTRKGKQVLYALVVAIIWWLVVAIFIIGGQH